jgi:hypothetical protein
LHAFLKSDLSYNPSFFALKKSFFVSLNLIKSFNFNLLGIKMIKEAESIAKYNKISLHENFDLSSVIFINNYRYFIKI